MTEPPIPEPEPAGGDPQTAGATGASVSSAVPPKCPTRTRLYRAGVLLEEGFAAEQISERLEADPDAVVWLDLYDPDTADLQIVTEEFGLHPLSVEDAINPHQRPKVDRYRSHCSRTCMPLQWMTPERRCARVRSARSSRPGR